LTCAQRSRFAGFAHWTTTVVQNALINAQTQ
jgi:hypothetical protein